jgi:hypothetical protein
MKRLSSLSIILILASTGYSAEATLDTSSKKNDSTILLNVSNYKAAVYKPQIALVASVIPGGGQVYTGHYIKAGLYMLAEAGVALFGYQRLIWQKDYVRYADSLAGIRDVNAGKILVTVVKTPKDRDTLITYDTAYPGIIPRFDYELANFQVLQNKYLLQQCAAWMAGIYYYNLMDALHATRYFHDDGKRDPSTAGLLSAIPFLGLGQIYNGELSKAGMIAMAQINMGFIAFNYQRLMTECEKQEELNPNSPEYNVFNGTTGNYKNQWESKRKDAFKNRNMWLWYSLMFYCYNIFDAIVDAHLHDAGTKMKLEPDLVPQEQKIGLTMTMHF